LNIAGFSGVQKSGVQKCGYVGDICNFEMADFIKI
jgi:hypothetical protein